MAFSHRDHRARRELRHLYIGFGSVVAGLALVAVAVPSSTIRILAVIALGIAGALYVVQVERMNDRYRRDLIAVRSGADVSGSVRAEVYHEVGFERDREDDWTPSPHHRTPTTIPGPAGPEPTSPRPTPGEHSDPPSDGS